MKSTEKIRKALEAVGGEFEIENGTMVALAPVGYIWAENGERVLAVRAENVAAKQSWYWIATSELKNRMSEGLEKCDSKKSAEIEYESGERWVAGDSEPEMMEIKF
jgi:hypothetical protein